MNNAESPRSLVANTNPKRQRGPSSLTLRVSAGRTAKPIPSSSGSRESGPLAERGDYPVRPPAAPWAVAQRERGPLAATDLATVAARSDNATYCWGSCCVVSGVRGQLANRRSGSWPPAPPRAAPGRVAPSLRERVPRCATRLGTALARRCRVSATACAEAAWLLAVARSL